MIENWLRQAMERNTLPPADQIRENITRPLLEQIKVDIGENVYDLAKGRLGFEGSPQSVRAQSRRLGVTRARVYQLLDDCSKVLEVRWPEGRCMLDRLQQRMVQEGACPQALDELAVVRDLLFPEKYEQVEAGAMAS